MSNFTFYDISEIIPTIIVKNFNPLIIVGSEPFQQKLPLYNAEAPQLDYFENAKEVGKQGEIIALNYLLTQFDIVEDVSLDAKLGYDIKADDYFYEVKTSCRASNIFFISTNELAVAYRNVQRHRLMFIKITDSTVVGYVIEDMFKVFHISWEDISQNIGSQGVNIIATKYCFELPDNHLKQFETIDLTPFWKKETT